MQHFYFNADLKGLIEYLKQYMTEEDIYRFIYVLDFLNEHLDKKNLTPSTNETIFNSLKYCNLFLIQLAIKKIIVDNAGKELTTEDISENLASIIALIPRQIKSNNKTYTIPNASIIMDIISKYDEDEKNTLKR